MKTKPKWSVGDVKMSEDGHYVWTCVIAEPDHAGRTVWECATPDGYTRYIVVDWQAP